MDGEGIGTRLRRQRRAEGKNWTLEDERAWQEEHPGDPPPEWMKDVPAAVAIDADLIPEPVAYTGPVSEADSAVDELSIIDAYQRWCGKMTPKVGTKRESVMISCPTPGHRDKTPSAWMNLDKGTWFCGACQRGGDKYDIAAFHFGYGDSYKSSSFPELKRKMAADLGFATVRSLSGKEIPVQETQELQESESDNPEPGPEPQPEVESEAPAAGPVLVTSEPEPEPGDEDNLIPFPNITNAERAYIDWEQLVTPQTFLDEWMYTTTVDDLPHEYYFWLGMQALGAATGPDVYLQDYRAVKTNLYICLYGKSGSGKSRALDPFMRVIRDALPFDGDDFTPSNGTKILPSPASAEALLYSFRQDILDPGTMKIVKTEPVRGLLRIEEFAAFVARASRHSSTMKETLIEMYDIWDSSITHYAVTQGKAIVVPNPFCQMVTTTQPKAIHNFMKRTDADSGFMNRWIFAVGTRRRERISHGGVSVDVTQATEYLRGVRNWASSGHRMELTGSALQVWDSFYQKELVPMLDTTDEAMFSRIDLTLKKLMLLFTANERLAHPTPEIVEKCCSLLGYLQNTYQMFSVDISHSDVQECQNEILKIVGSAKKPIAMGLITKNLGKFPRETVERSLKTLEALELLNASAEKTRAGVVKKYTVSDAYAK